MFQANQISKSYPDGGITNAVLQGASLQINQGELIAIQGPSGSGKSTLLNICGLLDDDFHGELMLNGHPVPTSTKQRQRLRRSQLGFVFQQFNLFPVKTAYENIAYPLQLNRWSRHEIKQRSWQLLEQIGLENHAKQRPSQLSGGQQQRIAIARAVAHRPALVIADEPTASLDGETAAAMLQLMRQLSQQHQVSFLLSSHDPKVIASCDRVLTLRQGRLHPDLKKVTQ